MVASPAGTPRVAIVGGGIGGLAAAAFLHRAGLSSTVYEQAPQLTEVGAGLVLAPNAARPLRRLGALDRLRGHAVPLDVGWEFRRWEDGRVLSAESLAGAPGDQPRPGAPQPPARRARATSPRRITGRRGPAGRQRLDLRPRRRGGSSGNPGLTRRQR